MIHNIAGLRIQECSPHRDGCFYCCTIIENFYMYYSYEFDCYVHRDCLLNQVKRGNEEAKIILKELNLKER